jgi:hypothetical protein
LLNHYIIQTNIGIFRKGAKTNWIKLEGGKWKSRRRNERAEGVREGEEGDQMGMRQKGRMGTRKGIR